MYADSDTMKVELTSGLKVENPLVAVQLIVPPLPQAEPADFEISGSKPALHLYDNCKVDMCFVSFKKQWKALLWFLVWVIGRVS